MMARSHRREEANSWITMLVSSLQDLGQSSLRKLLMVNDINFVAKKKYIDNQ
jgi:hypothetical protein